MPTSGNCPARRAAHTAVKADIHGSGAVFACINRHRRAALNSDFLCGLTVIDNLFVRNEEYIVLTGGLKIAFLIVQPDVVHGKPC